MEHEYWMQQAILQAQKAEKIGEVPIGAIVVHSGQVIGRGYNLRESSLNPTSHAEMIAIQEAAAHLQAWRLLDCTLYVTLEPCSMCAGAIIQARIPTVVYGAADPKAGCAGTLMNLLDEPRFNHRVELHTGILEMNCSHLLTQFFRRLREKK